MIFGAILSLSLVFLWLNFYSFSFTLSVLIQLYSGTYFELFSEIVVFPILSPSSSPQYLFKNDQGVTRRKFVYFLLLLSADIKCILAQLSPYALVVPDSV